MSGHSRHLPADERRAATVEAVVDLAAEQNPSDITTTAIAQRMGLTQGALFRHFPTKDAILQAVMSWVAERLLARVDKAAEGVLGILPPNIAKTAAGRASCGFWRPITYRLSAGSHQSIPLNPQVLAIHLSVRMCIYPGG